MTNGKRLRLLGLFVALSMIGFTIYLRNGDLFAAIGADGFALAALFAGIPILRSYKGGKRQ